MIVASKDRIRTLTADVVDAWQRGDADALNSLLAADFKLVGPLGFVVTKDEWLEQHRSGALVTQEITWDGDDVRLYGDSAITIGALSQKAEYGGYPASGEFRVTLVAVESASGLRLAGLHLSPIAQPGR
ncbi:MAG TPA: nuclear transport factor 2 family protein [Candidatus Limnocylindrales bacterium]